MLPQFLLPETVARQDGMGGEMLFERKIVLLTLGITRIIAQESLEVSVWGSADGQHWRPLVAFPQKFYCGTYTMVLDLSQSPGVRYLRAEYKAGRWGRGDAQPLFGFYVFIEDVISKSAASRAVA